MLSAHPASPKIRPDRGTPAKTQASGGSHELPTGLPTDSVDNLAARAQADRPLGRERVQARSGVVPIGLASTRQVVGRLPLLQGLRRLAALGKAAGKRPDAAAGLAAAVTDKMARIGKLESSHRERSGMAGALQVLRGNSARASQQVGNNPLAGYRRHAHRIEAAFALLDAVVRNSGLALDPDLTTTFSSRPRSFSTQGSLTWLWRSETS